MNVDLLHSQYTESQLQSSPSGLYAIGVSVHVFGILIDGVLLFIVSISSN